MFKKRFGALLAFSGILSSAVFAQSNYEGNMGLEYRKWRLTLLPPISTNWTNAPNYTAKYSINLLGGYHGGLDGTEVGVLFNATKYYSYGFQLAGVTNFSKGDVAGMSIAGGFNYAGDDMSGVQISGLANLAKESLEGMQITMGLNYSGRSSAGLQAAGIANVSNSNIEGLMAAGVLNYAERNVSGLQASGVANIAGDDLEGLVATGGINYAGGTASGLMAAAGFNVANEVEGLVAAGVANIAGSIEGLSAAPLNIANTGMGLQVGILNIAKEFEGMPLGVLSLYGNGRKNFDVRYSDAGFTDISVTTGTYRVYNLAMFGYNTSFDRNVYRIGFGFGLEKNIQDSWENVESNTLFVNQELSAHHIFEEEWDRTLNLIYSYKYMVGNRFGNGLSIYGGPSVNMQVTRVNSANDYTWYSLWSPERKGREYRFWVGFTIGMRIFHQKNLPLLEDEFDRFGDGWDW